MVAPIIHKDLGKCMIYSRFVLHNLAYKQKARCFKSSDNFIEMCSDNFWALMGTNHNIASDSKGRCNYWNSGQLFTPANKKPHALLCAAAQKCIIAY